MPKFSYKGRSSTGVLQEGILDGVDSTAVANRLLATNITPISIVEVKPKQDIIDQIYRKYDLYKVDIEELLMFTRQMSALLKAGIPIIRAISGILESINNPKLIEALRDIVEQLETGRNLSASFARHPSVFNNLYISMIQVGESTGGLEASFEQMAIYIDRNRKIMNNISTAIRYPTTVLIAISIAIGIVNMFVIPGFASFFEANDLELPLMTVVLLTTSKFTVDYWYMVIGGMFLAYYGFKHWKNTDEGRFKWGRMMLNFPVVGDILHRAYLARFARSFSMAYNAGVPIVQGMGVISRSIGNDYIAFHVNSMREGIERGESLTRIAGQTGMFTPVVMQMFAVGEEAGTLAEMMNYIADFYEEEVDYDIKTLTDKIEPIIYVAIGGLVLVLALGIFVPMWDLAQLAG
ncbi:MAG: type II secretion system F family protein [Gammaproteobacteria bacterium]|nr:type II secretion system F family protein [Gammaproteobacteria bacterium]